MFLMRVVEISKTYIYFGNKRSSQGSDGIEHESKDKRVTNSLPMSSNGGLHGSYKEK